jgi:hypothetical protein
MSHPTVRHAAPRPVTPSAIPYWRRVGEDVAHELPGLLGANALLLLWCAPAGLLLLAGLGRAAALVASLTLGPGLVGLLTHAGRLCRGEPACWWRDSLTGAREGYRAGTALAVIGLALVTGPALALRLATTLGPTTVLVALLTAQAAVAAFLLSVCVHALSLVGLYGQPASVALRNGLVLSLRHPVSSAGLLALAVLAAHLAQLLRWGPLVALPAILAVCAIHHTLRLVQDIDPAR